MTELGSFFFLAFSSLFTLVNPIGLSAVYLSMVEQFNDKERKQIAFKGTLTALVILLVFSSLTQIIPVR